MKPLYKCFVLCCVFLLIRITLLVSEKLLTPSIQPLPLIINTWQFKEANEAAWSVLNSEKEPLSALVEGLTTCERLQCDGTVGFGGSPDEKGGTALDAMIMDGRNQNMGAVAAMRDIKDAAKVAKYVLENTEHSLLVGEAATEFAEMMGFERESLETKDSLKKWFLWFSNSCQPNFWKNVFPNPKEFCGPYKPLPKDSLRSEQSRTNVEPDHRDFYNFGEKNHDTIGMIVIDKKGQIYAGTSTNGAIHKIPGRVGDSAIPGAGAYADNEVGAAVATGDGDIMMRFSPSALAVEYLRLGFNPEKAAESVIKRILTKYPLLSGAIIVIDKLGNYGSACAGMKQFPYSLVSGKPRETSRIQYKDCLQPLKENIKANCHENQLKLMAEISDLKIKLQEKESAKNDCEREYNEEVNSRCLNSNKDETDFIQTRETYDVYGSFKDWKRSKGKSSSRPCKRKDFFKTGLVYS